MPRDDIICKIWKESGENHQFVRKNGTLKQQKHEKKLDFSLLVGNSSLIVSLTFYSSRKL